MNKLKRILCAVLTVVMCLGNVTAIYAENEKQLSDKMSSRIEVLRMLGFITDYYDYNTVTSEYVSRGDFARIAARIVNADEYGADGQYYYDVPKNHYAYGSISALTEMGILNGVEEKRFEPEKPIELGQVYKVLLTLMHYNISADLRGGYPSGYMSIASELDLKVKGSAESPVTRGDMFTIVYDAMKTKMIAVNFEGGNDISYDEGDETLLSFYHDIYYDEGTVKAASGMSLTGKVLAKDDDVQIDNDVYKTELIMEDYLGEEVEFFYRKDDVNETNTVLWAKSTGKTDVLEIEADFVDEFNKNTFELKYLNSKNASRKVKLDRGITVLYNGREVGSGLDEIFNLPEYSVKLILDGNTAVAAIVEKSETITVGGINTADLKVYDRTNQTTRIDLNSSNYDYFSIEEADGSRKTFEDIKEGMVLSIYKSFDNQYIKTVMSSLSAEGKIESMAQTDKGTEIYIGGTLYLLPLSSAIALPKSGDDVKLYLDYKSRIAYIEYRSGSSSAVYIYKGIYDANEDKAILKVLHQNGKCMKLYCSDKVAVDGAVKKNMEDVIAALNEERNDKNSSFKPQIALITMNENSEVTSIDTSYVNPDSEKLDNSLSVSMPYGAYTYKWTGFLGGNGIVNSSTVIFSVPEKSKLETASEDEFQIKSKADLIDATGYMLETYKTKERIGYEQLAVMQSTGQGGVWDYNVRPFLVDNVVTMLNSDEEAVSALTGYNSTEPSVFMAGEGVSFENIKKGMLLRIKQNDRKEITDYEILFDPKNDIDENGEIKDDKKTDSQFGQSFGIVRGYVNDVVDGVIKIGRTSPNMAEQLADKQGSPILIYDADSKSISAGDFTDARTYYKDGNDCSIVIMQSYQGTPKMFVIYK